MTFFALVSATFVIALYSTGLKYLLHNRYAQLAPDLAFIGILILLIARQIRERRTVTRESVPLILAVCAYLGIGILELGNPNVPGLVAGLEGYRKTCLYIAPLLIGLYLQWDTPTAKRFILLLTLASVPLCLYSIKQFIAPTSFDLQIPDQNTAGAAAYNLFGVSRATSLFSSPFVLGFMGNIVIAMALFLAASGGPQLLAWVAACSGVAAVVVSLTRVNIFAGLVLAAVGPLLIMKKRAWVGRAIIGCVLVVLLGWALSLTPVGDQVTRSLDLRNIQEDRAFSRIEGYERGIDLLARNPLMGYGTGSAGDGLDAYFGGSVYLPASHNILLKIGFELGLAGLVAFIIVCISWVWIAVRRYRQAISREERALIGLAGCIFVLFLCQGISGTGIDNFPANAATSFLMGVTAGLQRESMSS